MSKTEVLYNDACPVCRTEVRHYAKISARAALPITYDDLGDTEKLAAWGLDREAAAKRLHVRKDGQIYAGIPAFIVLWKALPRYRWVARVIGLPGVHGLACVVYDHVLAPILYRFHIRRQQKLNIT